MPKRDVPPGVPLILLAKAQEWFARSLEAVLAPRGYRVVKAYTGENALQMATEMRPDAIILDLDLPEMGGMAVCRTLRVEGRVSDSTPILLTAAGPTTRQQRLDAFRAGACELQGQPVDPDEFLSRLHARLRCKFDADRQREISLVDIGSGLYNLAGVLRRAAEMQADAARRGAATACVAFAPEPGPQDGQRLADAFRTHGRASDAVARLDVAEFAVVAGDTDRFGAVRVADRLTRAVERAVGAGTRLRSGYHAMHHDRVSRMDPIALVDGARSALRESLHRSAGAP